MSEMLTNLADPSQVAGARNKEKRKIAEQNLDLKTVLSTVNGRRFIWRFLSSCGVYHTSFDTDALRMSYLEGKRSVGLQLLADIHQAEPEALQLMAIEEKKREVGNGKRKSGSDGSTDTDDADYSADLAGA